MTRSHALALLAAGIVGTGMVAALPAGAAANAAAAARVSFPNSVPALVHTAPRAAAPDAGRVITGEIYLAAPDPVGERALAAAVSTPGSAQYGHFLTPQEWIDRFAPSVAALRAARRYVAQNGGTIIGVPADRLFVYFSMPAPAAARAFATTLAGYRVAGRTVTAMSAAPSLPRSVARYVSGLDLGDARAQLTRPAIASPEPGAIAGGEPACSDYYGQRVRATPSAYGHTSYPTTLCGYEPAQLRSAGGLDGGPDGSGQTIAIVDAYDSPTVLADTNTYMDAVGAPELTDYTDLSPDPSRFVNKQACDLPSLWQEEQNLDVQSSHSIAPGAAIVYSGGVDCDGGIDLALAEILDHDRADIVSNSYAYFGEAVGDAVVTNGLNQQLQAAAEGIGLYFATGDYSDDSTILGYPAANFEASSPYVTAVGGTSEAIGADGSYLWETGWGTASDRILGAPGRQRFLDTLPGIYVFGAGGGVSSVFAEPDYQQGVVPDALATQRGAAARVVPDIADVGDPYTGFSFAVSPIVNERTLETGPLEYITNGGTSLATPIAAAKMALVQAATGRRIGFANPLLYAVDRADPGAFHDVSTPPPGGEALFRHSGLTGRHYLITLNDGLSLHASDGYDDVTGIGSLRVPELAGHLGST